LLQIQYGKGVGEMAYIEKQYRNVRVVCRSKYDGCKFCKDIKEVSEGFCKMCKRPLWLSIDDPCNSIIGYYDGNYKEVFKQGNVTFTVDFICRNCNHITTRYLIRRN